MSSYDDTFDGITVDREIEIGIQLYDNWTQHVDIAPEPLRPTKNHDHTVIGSRYVRFVCKLMYMAAVDIECALDFSFRLFNAVRNINREHTWTNEMHLAVATACVYLSCASRHCYMSEDNQLLISPAKFRFTLESLCHYTGVPIKIAKKYIHIISQIPTFEMDKRCHHVERSEIRYHL